MYACIIIHAVMQSFLPPPPLFISFLDNPNQVTRVVVAIETLDVNDNPPELDGPYETAVCDTSTAGQVCPLTPSQIRNIRKRLHGIKI